MNVHSNNEDDVMESTDTYTGPYQIDRSPRVIEQQVLKISPASSVDDLSAALDAADWLISRAKAIYAISRQMAIHWIDQNGDFNIGDTNYSVGYSTSTKCLNIPVCGQELLKAFGGDFDRYQEALVAQPFKPGYAKRVLDQAIYRSVFRTSSNAKLVNGVPQRILNRTDSRFVR